MTIAIMQPYFFPYIGYFQLINSVDKFIIYDNIEYTKKGWINRNRILANGIDSIISLPIGKDSDYLHIKERFIANNWAIERKKMLNYISESYRKAPFYKETYELIHCCIMHDDKNLFNFIFHSIQKLVDFLEIDTELVISSNISIDHNLKGEEKVISLCKKCNANVYINPIGGIDLYDKDRFRFHDIVLQFQKSNNIVYQQFENEFIPWLSIIDVLMFNNKLTIKQMINNFELS